MGCISILPQHLFWDFVTFGNNEDQSYHDSATAPIHEILIFKDILTDIVLFNLKIKIVYFISNDPYMYAVVVLTTLVALQSFVRFCPSRQPSSLSFELLLLLWLCVFPYSEYSLEGYWLIQSHSILDYFPCLLIFYKLR